jgi:signal transduction histidine kinase
VIARVFGAQMAIALGLLLGIWIVGGRAIQPLLRAVARERVDVALYLAGEVEAAARPGRRLEELEKALGLDTEIVSREPQVQSRRVREMERGGRRVWWEPGEGAPMVVPLKLRGEEAWLLLYFSEEAEAVPRRAGLRLLALGLLTLGAAALATRLVLRPLRQTSEAMARAARGDLEHRVPEGADVAGRMGRDFNRMAAQVQRLVRGQKELMAAVSHELRTPLSRARLQAELLAEEGAPPARIARLEADLCEIDSLVQELLESARLDQGLIALRREDVAVDELLAEALGSLDLGEREVVLEAPALRHSLDRARVLRALVNLLQNAQRYSRPESRLHLRARAEGAHLLLEVEDEGPGLPEEQRERLFTPFFRAEASRDRQSGGLGLGLMLVRQIAQAHGGEAQALRGALGGLLVRLRLPPGSASG